MYVPLNKVLVKIMKNELKFKQLKFDLIYSIFEVETDEEMIVLLNKYNKIFCGENYEE